MKMEHKICYDFNRQLLKFYSKSFYLSTLLLPRKKRQAVFALYGFCRFSDNLADKPRQRSQVEIVHEIHAVKEELEIAYRTGESEHPVLCAFIHAARKYGIPREYPLDLIRGILMDLEMMSFANFDELHLFSYRVAGVVGLMMTHIMGTTSAEAFEYAAKLGIAMQLTNILRDIQEDKNNGRIYLPLDEMKRFGVTPEDITNEQFSPELRKLIKFSAERAHEYYEAALPGIPMLSADCQFAIYSASNIYRGILTELEQRDYNPFLGRVFVTQSRKMRIILTNYFKGKLNLDHQIS